MVRLALAGDTMLGRGVGELLAYDPPRALVAPELVELVREADLFVLNLECCISERGEPWPTSTKQYFFRAPPQAVDLLTLLGVDWKQPQQALELQLALHLRRLRPIMPESGKS